jgi:PAS domain S-box-containing protein
MLKSSMALRLQPVVSIKSETAATGRIGSKEEIAVMHSVSAAASRWIPQRLVEILYIKPRYLQPGSLNAYLMALAIVAFATALRMATAGAMPGAQFITLFPAVVVVTLICGMAAGFFSVVTAMLCAWYFIIPPVFSFELHLGDAIALLTFTAVGILDVAIVGAMRTAIAQTQNLNATLTTIFESNPDAILLIDHGGQIVSANKRATDVFGKPADQLLGSSIENLLPERLRHAHVRHRDNFMNDPHMRAMGIGLELQGRRADGMEFPVDVQIGAIKLKDSTFAIATVRDLTQQNALARELSESKRQQVILEERERSAEEIRLWADAFQCAAIGIEISNPDTGRVRFVNPAYAEARGISVDDAKGMRVADVYAPEERGLLPAYFETADSLGHVSFESRHVRRDGSLFAVEIDVASKHDASGAVIYRLASSRDVTAAKLIEQQLQQAQKMEIIGQLSGGIAHDFNNLLTVIVGNAELLSEQLGFRQDLQRFADDICQSGERGAELTQRLLAFGRRQLLQPREIDSHDLLESMQKLLRRTLRENIEIRTALNSDVIMAFADRGQLESAVLNLALNAQDAMPAGGHLTVATCIASLDDEYHRLHPGAEPGEYALITVSDDGEGMTPDVAAHAFEPFFTTKEVGKGSGLGLSMVYGFVKQSNGHIALYSEPGVGTTVRIYLPHVTRSVSGFAEQMPSGAGPEPKGHETILVAEDDPFVRSSVIQRIESLGYAVVAAVNGNDALLKLAGNPKIDMLFTDIVMPGGMSGWELADRAHEIRPNLPIVFTSGYALEALADQGRAPAHSTVLTKPYRKADLARVLTEALTLSMPLSRERGMAMRT